MRVVPSHGKGGSPSFVETKIGTVPANLSLEVLLLAVALCLAVQPGWAAPNDRPNAVFSQAGPEPEHCNPLRSLERLPPPEKAAETPREQPVEMRHQPPAETPHQQPAEIRREQPAPLPPVGNGSKTAPSPPAAGEASTENGSRPAAATAAQPPAVPLIARLPKIEPLPPVLPEPPQQVAVPREIAPPTAAPVLVAEPVSERSEQIERIARQADAETRHGLELAGRGAYFAARSNFLAALRLIAEGLDTQQRTDAHRCALAAALTAMKEAEDFLPGGSRSEANVNLPAVITAHSTPVLKGEVGTLTSLMALNRYFTFAQSQFAIAADHEVAGSMALHSLGKLHTALARKNLALTAAAEPKAMVYYQAALQVYPENFLSANDLGVLLAQCGDYFNAQAMLQHSFAICPQSTTCHNLAVVYGWLGQPAMANEAARVAAGLQQVELARRQASLGSANAAVRWVDPRSFAETSSNVPNLQSRNSRKEVAPSGVATPAGPRHTDLASVRVASRTSEERHNILLCQALGPAAPFDICGIDCCDCNCRRRGWEAMRAIDWQAYAQGEYVGHARTAHVPEYRLRVDDQLDMVYRLTRDETPTPYRLNVGDTIQVESFTDHDVNRELLIQPDGTITLRLLGQVHATGRTVTQLRDDLEERYKKYYKIPAITVTPLKVNTKLEDLRAAIDRRAGIGGQSQAVRVTPEGTIALTGIGSVQAQGLTLPELQTEINEAYRQIVEGIQINPILVQRAPRFVYVLGEVNTPGRFELVAPTTALQAISLAGSWRVGANLRQIVVFRRGDDWRLLATMIDLQGALLGHQPCPPGEIWIDDSDVVIVPKSAILVADDFINLVFTRGLYGVMPVSTQLNFTKLSSL